MYINIHVCKKIIMGESDPNHTKWEQTNAPKSQTTKLHL